MFFMFLQKGCQKHRVFQIFGKRRKKTRTSKEPAGVFEPGTPVLRHRFPNTIFSGTSSDLYRAVRWGPPLSLGPLLTVRHTSAMPADTYIYIYICVYIHMFIYTYIHMFIHIYIYMYIHMRYMCIPCVYFCIRIQVSLRVPIGSPFVDKRNTLMKPQVLRLRLTHAQDSSSEKHEAPGRQLDLQAPTRSLPLHLGK